MLGYDITGGVETHFPPDTKKSSARRLVGRAVLCVKNPESPHPPKPEMGAGHFTPGNTAFPAGAIRRRQAKPPRALKNGHGSTIGSTRWICSPAGIHKPIDFTGAPSRS